MTEHQLNSGTKSNTDGSPERVWVTGTVLKTVEAEKRCGGSNPPPSANN